MNAGNSSPRGEVTRLLEAARGGEREALDQLMPLVYDGAPRSGPSADGP